MYIRTVRALANHDDPTKVNLAGILPPAIIMSVLVTATTTHGQPLSEVEWKTVQKACDLADRLEEARKRVCKITLSFSELMAILDLHVRQFAHARASAQPISHRRHNDSRQTPWSCWWSNRPCKNACQQYSCKLTIFKRRIIVKRYCSCLERKRKLQQDSLQQPNGATQDLSSNPTSYNKLPRNTSSKSNERLVPSAHLLLVWTSNGNGKLVCLHRIESKQKTYNDTGDYGEELREKVEKHIDRLAAPPPSKITKALPIPNEGAKKRRGGRRYLILSQLLYFLPMLP